jgi:hypothetical protein
MTITLRSRLGAMRKTTRRVRVQKTVLSICPNRRVYLVLSMVVALPVMVNMDLILLTLLLQLCIFLGRYYWSYIWGYRDAFSIIEHTSFKIVVANTNPASGATMDFG